MKVGSEKNRFNRLSTQERKLALEGLGEEVELVSKQVRDKLSEISQNEKEQIEVDRRRLVEYQCTQLGNELVKLKETYESVLREEKRNLENRLESNDRVKIEEGSLSDSERLKDRNNLLSSSIEMAELAFSTGSDSLQRLFSQFQSAKRIGNYLSSLNKDINISQSVSQSVENRWRRDRKLIITLFLISLSFIILVKIIKKYM